METTFDRGVINVEMELTRQFYLKQHSVIADCSCSDCVFFFENVIHRPFEIFKILRDFGVDLGKNLDSEPTGAWCVRDDHGELIHCDQTYQIFGKMDCWGKSEFNYSKFEDGWRVNARFRQLNLDNVSVALNVDRVFDENEIKKY